jgi:hypothetical protein
MIAPAEYVMPDGYTQGVKRTGMLVTCEQSNEWGSDWTSSVYQSVTPVLLTWEFYTLFTNPYKFFEPVYYWESVIVWKGQYWLDDDVMLVL